MARTIEFDLPERQEQDQADREPIALVINGKDTGHKVYAPTVEHITLFSRVASRMATPVDKMAGIFRFLEAVTDEDSYEYLVGRFEDPKDSLDFEWLTNFLVGMSELAQEDRDTPPPNRAARRGPSKTTKTPAPVTS